MVGRKDFSSRRIHGYATPVKTLEVPETVFWQAKFVFDESSP